MSVIAVTPCSMLSLYWHESSKLLHILFVLGILAHGATSFPSYDLRLLLLVLVWELWNSTSLRRA